MNSFFIKVQQQIRTDYFQPSSTSKSPLLLIFMALGITFGVYAIFYAWNNLRGRNITPISPKTPLPLILRYQSHPLPSMDRSPPVSKPARIATKAAVPSAMYTMFEKFYQNQGTDIKGRTLDQLQKMSFNDKERVHNYIQWMFPLDKASNFNSKAPVFSIEQFQTLNQNPAIKANIKNSFLEMLEFYGLQYQEKSATVEKSSTFEDKAKNWLRYEDHNHRRISRILRCLMLFDLKTEAQAFYQFLLDLQPHPAISKRTASHWKYAMRPVERKTKT